MVQKQIIYAHQSLIVRLIQSLYVAAFVDIHNDTDYTVCPGATKSQPKYSNTKETAIIIQNHCRASVVFLKRTLEPISFTVRSGNFNCL